MIGPVQVLVVGFDQPSFSGEVLAELGRLEDAGVVRLVDLLVVARADDGTLETVTAPEGPTAGLGLVTAALFNGTEGAASVPEPESGWSLADTVPPGSAAAVALVEHLWAEPLVAAIQRAGGRPLEETWLGPEERVALDGLLAGAKPASD